MEQNVQNFIGKDQWKTFLPDDFFESSLLPDTTKVVIVRIMAFFYREQKTTLGDLRKIYTEKAVNALLHDGFIEVIQKKE